MKKRKRLRISRIKVCIFFIWTLFLWNIFSWMLPGNALVAGKPENQRLCGNLTESASGSVGDNAELPTLIQATTPESDYQALTALGLTMTKRQHTEDLEEAFQKILCSCVRIQVEGHYGSGSIYQLLEDEIIIVSNRHVLQYWNQDSYVTFWNGMIGSGSLIGISEKADVGFVSIPTSSFTYEELLKLRNIRTCEAKEGSSPESPVLLVDMASDEWNPVMYEGRIINPAAYLQDFGMEMLYGSGFAKGGMSGSGVFDGYGNYLGMLTGGTLNNEFAAVPIKVIKDCYEQEIKDCYEQEIGQQVRTAAAAMQ